MHLQHAGDGQFNPVAADAAVAKFAARESIGSNMVRTYCPPFGFEHDPREARAMETLLADWQPHLVFVGLTSPKQDVLIRSLRPVLPGAWYLGLGVSFSFVAGDVKRAPPWMQRSGLEWLHRLLQEPVRLAKRYLLHGLPFAAGLLWRATLRRYR